MRHILALLAFEMLLASTAPAFAEDVPTDAGSPIADAGQPEDEAGAPVTSTSESEDAAAKEAAAKAAADAAAKAAADAADAAAKAAADAAAKAAADAAAKAAADAAAKKAAALPTDPTAPTQFEGGYTDEEECRDTAFVALDPYDLRPAISSAFSLGFGGGYTDDDGAAGIMVGEAALRAGFVRVKAELSGGTSLSHLDVAAGADVGIGYRRFRGKLARAGYARGWRIGDEVSFHELRADIGLASIEGFSWLSARMRVDDAFGFDAFFIVIEIERVR